MTSTALDFAAELQAGFLDDLHPRMQLLFDAAADYHRARALDRPGQLDASAARLREWAGPVGRVLAAWDGIAGLDTASAVNGGQDCHVLDVLDLADAARRFADDGDGAALEAAVVIIFDRRATRQE